MKKLGDLDLPKPEEVEDELIVTPLMRSMAASIRKIKLIRIPVLGL